MSTACTLKNELLAFLADSKNQYSHRAWLENNVMRVYLRVAPRLIGGRVVKCLDIANVTVQARHRHKGVFSEFLAACKMEAAKCGLSHVFIENVATDRFANYFDRKGYIKYQVVEPERCFFLPLTADC